MISFLRPRWQGELPLRQAFLQEMLLVGTTVNIATAVLGLALFATEVPSALAATVYFAPLPYNLLLFVSVWRSAAASRSCGGIRLAAGLWVALTILI